MSSDPLDRRPSPDARRIASEIVDAGDGTDPFVAIVRATRMPMCMTDPRLPDNPIVFANDSFCKLTGYARDEVIGHNCRFLQGPDTDPAAVAQIRAAIAAQKQVTVDIRNYRKTGEGMWVRLLLGPVYDDGGALAYFFASQLDVTVERERLAELETDNASLTVELADRLRAQQESEERLRFAADAGRLGLWEVDFTTLDLTASAIFRENFGFRRDGPMTNDDARAVTHPDDRERVRAAVRATREDGAEFDIEFRVIRPDGIGWVHQRAEVIRAADGTPLRIAGTSLDITSRKAVEAALVLGEESLRLATDAGDVGTWDLNLTTDVLTWSDRTKAMFGISPGVPCSMADFYAGLHPDDRDATSAAFAAATDPAVRAVYDVEYRTIGKEDGVVRWVAAKGKGLFDGGRCIRAIGSVLDITRSRRAAEQQAFLLDLTDRVRAIDEPGAIVDAAMTALGGILGANRVGYGQVQDDDATIVLVTPYVDGAAVLDGSYLLDSFGPLTIARNRAGETVVVPDVTLDPALDQATWDALGTRAFVSVPLVRDGRLRATLFVNHSGPWTWDAGEVALIEDVAARTWDAVERARAEAERHLSEARLRAVIDAAPIGLIFARAPDGEIIGGNARAEAIMRHPVLPSPDVEHYDEWVSCHADGRRVEGREYPLARALAGEERPELEVLYRRGDATDAYIRFVAAPIRATDGAVVGGVVASIDIDRERRAELALRDLNATLETRIAESVAERDAIWRESRDMLLVIDRGGVIEAVNPAWTETLGYPADALVGHRYSDFIVAEDVPASDAALATIEGEPLRNFENRYRHADGSIRQFAWTASAANGKMYCIARDVTAERAAARELAAAQEALRQAQKMEAVGQLTGGIAHDFNNMLAVVLGSLDLLGRRLAPDDARARRYVDAALDGARRAASLTQRLLAFSRQQPLQPEPVDVNRLVAGMSDLLRGSLGGSIQLETVLAGGLWPVHADPNQLENVILNLGINARDAMAGEGRVTIETANAHLDDRYVAAEIGVAAGQYVLIAVTDAGAGMAPEIVAQAFDPFFTTKGVGKGTGLGLSQVYGFVKQSGGHVKIYSEVGVGTAVKLYLPRLIGDVAAAAGGEPAVPVGGDGHELILVVEDEPGVRAVSVEALRDLGYRVVEADGAAAALRLLATHPDIALLFTDIVMPEMNGARLVEAARALRPGLKVLFTTGYTRNAVVHNGVVDAGVDLIGKPFSIDALAAKVRSVLDG